MNNYDDDEDVCIKCGRKQFSTSNMTSEVIFQVNTVNTCGHKFCEMCLENELSRKRTFACPKCKSAVSREKLSRKSLDENEVERDFRIRRRIFSIFNQTEDQFENLDQFKDYEEEREEIIYNLVHGIDEEDAERRVKDYEAMNILIITTNQSRKIEEKMAEEASIRAFDEKRRQRVAAVQDTNEQEKRDKKEYDRQMNELALGERDRITVEEPKRRDEPSFYSAAEGKLASSTSSAAVAPASTISHVVLFLRRRAEPVPTGASAESLAAARLALMTAAAASTTMTSTPSSTGILAPPADAYSAGGFHHSNYTKRNWVEIMSSISVIRNSVQRPRHSQEIC